MEKSKQYVFRSSSRQIYSEVRPCEFKEAYFQFYAQNLKVTSPHYYLDVSNKSQAIISWNIKQMEEISENKLRTELNISLLLL